MPILQQKDRIVFAIGVTIVILSVARDLNTNMQLRFFASLRMTGIAFRMILLWVVTYITLIGYDYLYIPSNSYISAGRPDIFNLNFSKPLSIVILFNSKGFFISILFKKP